MQYKLNFSLKNQEKISGFCANHIGAPAIALLYNDIHELKKYYYAYKDY